MKELFNSVPRKIQILLTVLIVAIVLTTILVLTNNKKGSLQSIPIISSSPPPITSVTPLQKVIINQTTTEDFKNRGFEAETITSLPENQQKYTLNSPLIARPYEVIFSDNVAIFERVIVAGNSTSTGYTKISQFISKFGQPEKALKGSNFYGYHMTTYIFALKGMTIIGNSNTDDVYEIQSYLPTTVDNYIKLYGEDINETSPGEEF